MNLTFLKLYIIDALKCFYPTINIGKRDFSKETSRNLVPVDFVCKECASCIYNEYKGR